MTIFRQPGATKGILWALAIILLFVLLAAIGVDYARLKIQASTLPTPTPAQANAEKPRRRVVMIVHGDQAQGFWSVVRRGAEQGAQEEGVNLELHGLKVFDMAEMSRLIDEAVASRPDGMVISLPDVKALTPSVQKIVEAKIPFVVINAGRKESHDLGALTYIGQQEYEAGYAAGMRMAEAGVRRAYCINHEPGNAATVERCQGFSDALMLAGGKTDVLAIDKGNLDQARERIVMGLQIAPDTDGLLAVSDLPIAIEAVESAGMQGQVKVAQFDFSPQTLEVIENRKMLFAVDQQQYLQGYLPVVFLNLYFSNANTVPQEVIATGPSFITQDNAALIKNLSTAGTR